MTPVDEKYPNQPVPLELEYRGEVYRGLGIPLKQSCSEGICRELSITLNREELGIIHCTKDGWKMDNVKDQALVDLIGERITLWYE